MHQILGKKENIVADRDIFAKKEKRKVKEKKKRNGKLARTKIANPWKKEKKKKKKKKKKAKKQMRKKLKGD